MTELHPEEEGTTVRRQEMAVTGAGNPCSLCVFLFIIF